MSEKQVCHHFGHCEPPACPCCSKQLIEQSVDVELRGGQSIHFCNQECAASFKGAAKQFLKHVEHTNAVATSRSADTGSVRCASEQENSEQVALSPGRLLRRDDGTAVALAKGSTLTNVADRKQSRIPRDVFGSVYLMPSNIFAQCEQFDIEPLHSRLAHTTSLSVAPYSVAFLSSRAGVMQEALARLERLEIALGPLQDAKHLKESVLKAQADLVSLEKQYPSLAELSAKHGAQSRALLSGTRSISDAARTQIIIGKEPQLREAAQLLQEVNTHEQYLNSEPLQGLSNSSSAALTLNETHAGQTRKADQVSSELQQRMLAYNDLVMALSLKFAQLDDQLRRLEQRVSEAEKRV